MATNTTKKWCGPSTCEICHKEPRGFFVDGRTRMGPWALMCASCWKIHGVGEFGKGYAQKYDAQSKEKLAG